RVLDGLRAIDDVIVRHGKAIRRNEEAGTLTGHLPVARLGLWHALLHAIWHSLATELIEELLEGRSRIRFALVVVAHAGRFHGLVDLDADRNHGRFHFRDHIRKATRRLNAVRERARP